MALGQDFSDNLREIVTRRGGASAPVSDAEYSRALHVTALGEENDILLSQQADGIRGGLQGRGSKQAADADAVAARLAQQKRDDTARFIAMLDTLEATAAQLADIRQDLDTIDEFLNDLADGEIERNADGSLANERYEEILREYEERTGQQVDRNDVDAIRTAARNQQEWLRGEEAEVRTEYRGLAMNVNTFISSEDALNLPSEELSRAEVGVQEYLAATGDDETREAIYSSNGLDEDLQAQIERNRLAASAALGPSIVGGPNMKEDFLLGLSLSSQSEEVENIVEDDLAQRTAGISPDSNHS